MYHLDNDTKFTYNTVTNIQTMEIKKIKLTNYQELMEYYITQITHQKNFVLAIYLAA